MTQKDMELTQERIAELDRVLRQALEQKRPVTLTRFVPDGKKDGGAFETLTDFIKKADPVEQVLILRQGLVIPLWTIREIGL